MMYVPSPLYIYDTPYMLTSPATIHSRSSWVYQPPAADKSRSKLSRIGQEYHSVIPVSQLHSIPLPFLDLYNPYQ